MIIDFLRQLNSYFAHSPHSACAKARASTTTTDDDDGDDDAVW